MCQALGSGHPGEVLCFPPVRPGQAVTSGTYCLHTCHGHTKTEMMCQHSLWSTSPDSLSCEGKNMILLTKHFHTRKISWFFVTWYEVMKLFQEGQTKPDTIVCGRESISLFFLSFQGSNSTSFSALRGKSLEVRPQLSPERIGSLASIKMAEMKNRETVNKPVMKTKVSVHGIIWAWFVFGLNTTLS